MSFSIREGSLAPLTKAERRPHETWHADVFKSPLLVETEVEVVRPLLALVQEPNSYYILAIKPADIGETPEQALGDGIVKAMLSNGIVPGRIGVKPPFVDGLRALGESLGLSVYAQRSMPALVEARKELRAYIQRNPPDR